MYPAPLNKLQAQMSHTLPLYVTQKWKQIQPIQRVYFTLFIFDILYLADFPPSSDLPDNPKMASTGSKNIFWNYYSRFVFPIEWHLSVALDTWLPGTKARSFR